LPNETEPIAHDSVKRLLEWQPHPRRRHVHRLVNHGEKQYSDEKGNHINGLEGFWGYLKRKLSSKDGIRREKRAS